MHELKRQNPYMRLIFLFAFFALSIGDAFNVLFIKEMAETFAPADKLDLFISIPVTAMSAMMILGVICSDMMVRKKGNMVPFLRISVLLTVAGMLLRGLAFHYIILLAGFMAVGFGYGCFYIGIRYYAYLFEDETDRLETMAVVSGGSFAGQCMGTVLGGIMAGQMPYRMVYLLSTVLLLVPLILVGRLDIPVKIKQGSIIDAINVLKKGRSMVFLIFMVLPLFACTVFTSYTVPLEIDRYGYSATVISALLLAAYMIAAYAGPVMTKAVSGAMSALQATFVYCIGVSFLIAVFSLGRTFPLLILVVLLLGFLDSFGPSVMTEAYMSVHSKGKGGSDALMIYILVTRLGMTVAPTIILVFGSTIALSGFVIIGMALFLFIGTFINAFQKDKGQNEES